jgi:hypothetical protein
VKILVIGFALLGLVFAALAIDEWNSRPEASRPAAERGALRGGIGDEPTAGIYLALAAAMIWVGLFTDWALGRPE